jgi:hypothetical protein
MLFFILISIKHLMKYRIFYIKWATILIAHFKIAFTTAATVLETVQPHRSVAIIITTIIVHLPIQGALFQEQLSGQYLELLSL